MANGYTTEQMLDRIEAHLLRVEEKVDKTQEGMADIRESGCAIGTSNKDRIRALEVNQRAGVAGFIALAGGLITDLLRR